MRFWALFVLVGAGCIEQPTPQTTDVQPSTVLSVDEDRDGHSTQTDCDDSDPAIFPGAEEACNGVDDDCDTQIDEPGAIDGMDAFIDADEDGFGDPQRPISACELTPGVAEDGTDCDDTDPAIHPEATEVCDQVDNDCDQLVDDDDAEVTGALTWFLDEDGDGYGVDTTTLRGCAQPPGHADNADDCDDAADTVNPGATEVCDPANTDEDCDGATDDADPDVDPVTRSRFYRDGDSDSFGHADTFVDACDAPAQHVVDHTDCNDENSTIHPGATEVCDPLDLDEDCSGAADDADPGVDPSTRVTVYIDQDNDTFGDPGNTLQQCNVGGGAVANSSDCDDGNSAINPAAYEICDGVDNDCDQLTDDADGSVMGGATWYLDGDLDGFGGGTHTTACVPPSGYVGNDDDCDDAAPGSNPAAIEVCDADDTDENCNGVADDADLGVDPTSRTWFYADADADGYGDPTSPAPLCDLVAPYLADDTDCDDADDTVNPGTTERGGDAVDDDCDGDLLPPPSTLCPPTGVHVPADFPTITDALVASAEVCLDEATYTETLTCEACTLYGHGRGRTVLDGDIDSATGGVTLHDLTLNGAVSSASALHLERVDVSCVSGDHGAAIEVTTAVDAAGGPVLLEGVRAACVPDGTHFLTTVGAQLDVRHLDAPAAVTVRNSHFSGSTTGVQLTMGGNSEMSAGDVTAALANNTFEANGTGLVNRVQAIVGLTDDNTHLSLYNNLFVDNATGWDTDPADPARTIAADSNAFFGNTTDVVNGAALGPDAVLVDPDLDGAFTPPRPHTGSALIGAADPDYLPSVDYWGVMRDTTTPTIGATENR